MDLKVKVNTITIKDEDTGQKYSVKTVRTVKEIWEYLDEIENDALSDKVADLAGQY